MGPSWKERIVRHEIDNINCILQSKFNKYTPKRQLVKTRYQVDVFYCLSFIYSQLSRCSTASGSGSWLSQGDPTKVRARKSVLFTEGLLKFENKEHLVDLVVTPTLTLRGDIVCLFWNKRQKDCNT